MTKLARDPLDNHTMLSAIRLKNFKCYRDSGDIRLAPLTVIVGRNNSGKSTITQPILALRQTLRDISSRPRLVTVGQLVNLGGFFDIVHRGCDKRGADGITIEVSRDLRHGRVEAPRGVRFTNSTRLSISFAFNNSAQRIDLKKITFSDEQGHPLLTASDNPRGWRYKGIDREQRGFLKMRFVNFIPHFSLSSKSSNPTKKLIDAYMSADMQVHPWLHVLADVSYIEPLRSHIPFYIDVSAQTASGPYARGENLIRSLASSETKNDITKLQRINSWLADRPQKSVTNLRIQMLDRKSRFASLVADDPDGHRGINVAAMGEGISQFLPIVNDVLHANQGHCVIIEQPEIHLHPAAQGDLGDLFVDATNTGKRQLIVETHSEHLLLRIRRRIAEGVIKADDVSILFVDKTKGESTVESLILNGNGHFDNWPKGFFGEGYNEAMALAMAQPVHGHHD